MKKSREEDRKNRKAIPKAENRQESSSNSGQPSSSRVPSKQKAEPKKTGKPRTGNNKHDVEQLFREILKVSNSMNMCDDLFPFLEEYSNSFTRAFEDNDRKLYCCPEISDEILPKHEWLHKIQDYIMLVHESDPILAAVLAVKSLNPKEKADECFSIIARFLKNIIESPENEKYRHIRCQNPIVESKVLSTEGALLFLGTIGFHLESENEVESFLTFNENHYHLKEVIQLINNVKGFQLTAFEDKEVGDRGDNRSDGSREEDFYKLTSKDLKKNQKLREKEIEKESQLRTKSMREKEKRLIPKTKFSKIRIRTPEGKIVESTFTISDRLGHVYQYIDQNVANGRRYTLMMPPATPFKDSDSEKSLAELELFPAVLLTLKWDEEEKKARGKR